jgi:hypothetical protein
MRINQFAAWSFCLGFVLSSSVAATAIRAEDSPAATGPKLQKKIGLTDTIAIATNVSDDGQVATVLFSGFDTELSAGSDSPNVRTRAASFTVPIKGNKTATCLTQVVTGYVDLGGSTRATLVIRACGRTTAIDIVANDFAKPRKSNANAGGVQTDAGSDEEASNGRIGNFEYEVPGYVPENGQYTLSLVLLLDRDNSGPDEVALVAIDSIEIEVTGSAPAH